MALFSTAVDDSAFLLKLDFNQRYFRNREKSTDYSTLVGIINFTHTDSSLRRIP